jgi:Amt family ammonium transporter
VTKTTLSIFLLLGASLAFAQAPAAAPPPAPAAAPAAAPITDADLKNVETPKPEAKAAGDPDGSLTGNASDIVVADPKKGLTISDVLNQIGSNRIGINFTWTLIAGFLVMFMQAGFAIVETGLCRAKNANYTLMMNFMV